MPKYLVRTRQGWWREPCDGTTPNRAEAHVYDSTDPGDVEHVVTYTISDGALAGGQHRVDGPDPLRLREVIDDHGHDG